jgi:hypothetical protein
VAFLSSTREGTKVRNARIDMFLLTQRAQGQFELPLGHRTKDRNLTSAVRPSSNFPSSIAILESLIFFSLPFAFSLPFGPPPTTLPPPAAASRFFAAAFFSALLSPLDPFFEVVDAALTAAMEPEGGLGLDIEAIGE